jgi:hypothetical protein
VPCTAPGVAEGRHSETCRDVVGTSGNGKEQCPGPDEHGRDANGHPGRTHQSVLVDDPLAFTSSMMSSRAFGHDPFGIAGYEHNNTFVHCDDTMI